MAKGTAASRHTVSGNKLGHLVTEKRYTVRYETRRFDPSIANLADLHFQDKNEEPDRTSIINISDNKRTEFKLVIDWANHSSGNNDIKLLLVSETDSLLFGTRVSWGLIDLKTKTVLRQESCVDFWSFTRYSDSILVLTELEAFSLTLDGLTIDQVPIDPPYDSRKFADRIEFESPVYGRQTLRLKNDS